MNLFEMAEDIIIDVPKFWNFAADILGNFFFLYLFISEYF